MKIKMILYITLILISLNFISAAGTELKFIYNSQNDSSFLLEPIYYSQSVLINVATINEVNCRWGYNENTIANNFDTSYGTNHELTLNNLEDGLHKYYIQCNTPNNTIMQISFKTKTKIYSDIYISEENPLKAGVYKINLITSTTPSETPQLEYSLDGIVYNPLPLTGSGKSWETNILIEKNVGETIGSFKFRAMDLDGTIGTKISNGGIFHVDTISPGVIESLDANGRIGKIELSWYIDEEIKEYNIYRSENPGVDYTDYIKTTDETTFSDTDVKTGKTYYYKVVAVDKARNIGTFSREVSATVLTYETNEKNGLSQNLLGKVENKLTEINLIKNDIETIKDSISSKAEKEKELFTNLELINEISSSISEIDSIKTDTERLKLQDLTENELNQKLNQISLKTDIIKKKVPESITIQDEYHINREITEEDIETMILEYGQETLTEKQQKETLSLTKELIASGSIKIESHSYFININFLDGTSQEKTVIIDNIDSNLERDSQTKILILIPKEIVEKASELKFYSISPEIIKDDPLIAFESETNNIVYSIGKEINPTKIEDITILPLVIYSEIEKTSMITGFATFEQIKEYSLNKTIIPIIAIVIILLGVYITIRKRNKYSKEFIEITELIRERKEGNKNKEELNLNYNKIKDLYAKLQKNEKKKVYKKIKELK
jgi:hypothetical protein